MAKTRAAQRTAHSSPARPTGHALAAIETAAAKAAASRTKRRAADAANAARMQALADQARAAGRGSVDLDEETRRHAAEQGTVAPSAGVKGKHAPPPMLPDRWSGRSGPFVPALSQGEPHQATKIDTGPLLDRSPLSRKT